MQQRAGCLRRHVSALSTMGQKSGSQRYRSSSALSLELRSVLCTGTALTLDNDSDGEELGLSYYQSTRYYG